MATQTLAARMEVTGQRMRVLYEDLVAKMAITGEGTPRKRKR
jgi:hypothetical protein